jgi:shikimate dehydrogenase
MTPVVQNAALAELAVNVRNIAFRVESTELSPFLLGARAAGLLGVMVTIPHKVAAAKLVGRVDPFGRLIGSINLIHFAEDAVHGYNTDGYAASRSLKEHGVEVRGARIAVLGAGGAGRCLAHRMAQEGAASIALVNRTGSRAAALAHEVRQHADLPVEVHPHSREGVAEALRDCTLVVNATSVGMHPQEDETPIPSDLLRADLAVYDIVYNPLETRLLREAAAAGARTVDGVGMLVYTNERAVQVCVGKDPSIPTMMDACYEALRARQGNGV